MTLGQSHLLLASVFLPERWKDNLHPNPLRAGVSMESESQGRALAEGVGQLEGKGWDARVDPRAET